jgi:glycosyltransferase involved in cell wall biosynthesis
VTGFVPELRPYYAHARVVVAPMHAPAGQYNKVMDGLAAGRPVVATSFANRGIGASCVLLSDATQDFAANLIRLFQDSAEWASLAETSRTFALENFNWPGAVAQLEERYLDLVERRRKGV